MKMLSLLLCVFLASPLFAKNWISSDKPEKLVIAEGANEDIHLVAGPGMVFYWPYGAGFGINVGLGARIASPSTGLYLGADLGISFLGEVRAVTTNGTTYSLDSVNNTGATAIHLLPTLYYRANLGSSALRQYIGVSVGPNIFIQSIPSSSYTNATDTKLYFQFLIRPGLELRVSRQVGFLFEPKFGVLRTSFVFMPQANVTVAF